MASDGASAPTAKGRRSRESILRAAAERFESDGFERTTIRAIAKQVALDPAMVIRYFGSKERLFLAATTTELDLPRVDAAPEEGLGLALARHAVMLWGSERPGRALRILLRSSAQDVDAAARVRSVFTAQVLPVLTGEPTDSVLRASFVTSQILGYAFGRYVIGLEPFVDLSDEEAAHWLGASLQTIIDAPQQAPSQHQVPERCSLLG